MNLYNMIKFDPVNKPSISVWETGHSPKEHIYAIHLRELPCTVYCWGWIILHSILLEVFVYMNIYINLFEFFMPVFSFL